MPCYCQSNTKNIFARFFENILSLSKEIEKNTENVTNSKLKIASSKVQHHKVSNNHQSIFKNICAKFQRKTNGSQEIEKKYCKIDQKISQNGL